MINVTFQMDPDNLEGAGSFYQRPLLTYLYALGKGYSFRPILNTHSSCHYEDAEYGKIAKDWEDIFNFLGESIEPSAPITQIDELIDLSTKYLYHVPFSTSYSYLEKISPEERGRLLGQLRMLFKEHISKYPKFNPPQKEGTVIALHLRDRSKGDPNFSKKKLLDWQMFSIDYGLPDNNPDYYSRLYANAINKIILANTINNPILHIHSTGEEKSFQQLLSLIDKKVKVKLFLNAHPPESFLDLIRSDYLIASHSSFSWLASLLRSGPTFIRKNFRHFVTPDTQVLEEVLYKDKKYLKIVLIKARMKISYYLFKKSRSY